MIAGSKLILVALLVMFAGPLLQGLGGFSDPKAYVFAPIIAVCSLPPPVERDLRQMLLLAGTFLAIGLVAMGLWWLGRQFGPVGVHAAVPVGVTIVGAGLALVARFLAARRG